MSPEQKSNLIWRASASMDILRTRAHIIQSIRAFFDSRHILEVETPIMSRAAGTDPYIQSIEISIEEEKWYLQTSPEFAMKRLLASGSESIYQICKAFRGQEIGRFHNPEFTMAEWYRLDFDHHQLIDEVDALFQWVLHTEPAERLSYQQAFETILSINPHTASAIQLKNCASQNGIRVTGIDESDRDVWLQLLMSEVIELHIGKRSPTFIYDYPASQASLSRIRPGPPPLAERFEAYFHGVELANGFHELTDAKEQRSRFEQEQIKRKKLGFPEVSIDQRFLAALEAGLPHCAGVALGIDRLVMIALGKDNIQDVLSFPSDRI